MIGNFLRRLIMMPFILGIFTVSFVFNYITQIIEIVYNTFKYGGETIIYTKEVNTVSLLEIFKELKKK